MIRSGGRALQSTARALRVTATAKTPVPAAAHAPAITDQNETNKKDRALGLFCLSKRAHRTRFAKQITGRCALGASIVCGLDAVAFRYSAHNTCPGGWCQGVPVLVREREIHLSSAQIRNHRAEEAKQTEAEDQ